MIDVTDSKKSDIEKQKKREKNQKSKIKIPKRSFPLRALSFSSPLSPSPPHPSIPIIRYIHTYIPYMYYI